jgi:hypothetical protein
MVNSGEKRNEKVFIIANITLGVISFLLLLQLFGVPKLVAGKAYEVIIPGEPFCAVQWGEEKTVFNDMDHCCLYARTQVNCERRSEVVSGADVQWDCYTGKAKVVHYLLNQKGYRYCQRLPIGVD